MSPYLQIQPNSDLPFGRKELIYDTRWYPLRYHPTQMAYWNSSSRFNIVPAGRRSGKTELAKRKTTTRSLLPPALGGSPFPDPRYFFGAPTRDQAKRIFWRDLKLLVPDRLRSKPPSETQLIIYTATGAELCVVGMDKPERIEGIPWDGGILDEYGNMKKETWPEHVRPALSDRNGWCDLIGVPEGRNHYYKEWKRALADETGVRQGFTWLSADILPATEIEEAKKDLDELTYKQEYEGSFINFTGRVYWTFSEDLHCQRLLQFYDPRSPLIFAFDFNVAPGVAAVGQEITLELRYGPEVVTCWLGEVWIPRGSNTILVCNRLIKDWGKHKGQIRCYGDSTGGARGTAKTEGSDWELIRRKLYQHYGASRVRFRVPKGNPRERDRVNSVNSRCLSTDGRIRMMVDGSNCTHTVEDFEGTVMVDGGSGEIDKKADDERTHITDAIGYYTHREFPIKKQYMEEDQEPRYWK